MEVEHLSNIGEQKPVNFIVGDEQDEISHVEISEDEKKEDTDIFPLATRNGFTTGLTNNNSYKDIFGLAEKRKQLR